MTFQIKVLPMALFAPFFHASDAQLDRMGARRLTADHTPGFPCRVSLAESEIEDTLILCNFEHLAEISPYRASHAIYVRQGAVQATPAVDEVPMVLTRRMLLIRGFGYDHLLKEAEVIDGATLAATLGVFFGHAAISYTHIQSAQPGCFAAKATRG